MTSLARCVAHPARSYARGSGRTPLVEGGGGDARAAARRVLAQGRFRQEGLPRPLHGPLAWLGRRLAPLGRPFAWLAGKLGGADWALTLLGSVVAVAAFALAFFATQRRAAAELLYFPGSDEAARAASPAELERLAAERERDGDYEGAVRLRFRAGLLSLDRARAIRYRPSLTTGELSRTLRSDDFDEVAHSFDEIVYGGRQAAEGDARAAHDGWQRIIARLRGRGAA